MLHLKAAVVVGSPDAPQRRLCAAGHAGTPGRNAVHSCCQLKGTKLPPVCCHPCSWGQFEMLPHRSPSHTRPQAPRPSLCATAAGGARNARRTSPQQSTWQPSRRQRQSAPRGASWSLRGQSARGACARCGSWLLSASSRCTGCCSWGTIAAPSYPGTLDQGQQSTVCRPLGTPGGRAPLAEVCCWLLLGSHQCTGCCSWVATAALRTGQHQGVLGQQQWAKAVHVAGRKPGGTSEVGS